MLMPFENYICFMTTFFTPVHFLLTVNIYLIKILSFVKLYYFKLKKLNQFFYYTRVGVQQYVKCPLTKHKKFMFFPFSADEEIHQVSGDAACLPLQHNILFIYSLERLSFSLTFEKRFHEAPSAGLVSLLVLCQNICEDKDFANQTYRYFVTHPFQPLYKFCC